MLSNILSGGTVDAAYFYELLLRLPAIVLAIVLHESAHGYVALKCGDPTARNLGRITLNPVRHFDPFGFLMMLFVGVGWAKPVPVNPRNFRNYRRDDLLVSIAGVTVNLMLFLVGSIAVYAMLIITLKQAPNWSVAWVFEYAPFMTDRLIDPVMGRAFSTVYEIIANVVTINLGLAVFNLLPVPPLDGYHVFNDILFKRSLFPPQMVQRIGMLLVIVLVFTDWLSRGLGAVMTFVIGGVGQGVFALVTALGIV